MEREYIAIPMGDPAGIGPEIVVKSLNKKDIHDLGKHIVIGDKKVLEKAIDITKSQLKINVITNVEDGIYEAGILNLIDCDDINVDEFEYGKVSAQCGQAAFDYISKAIELCMSGEVIAMATTPINKEAFAAAKVPYIGHSEILADLTNTPDASTMFQVQGLRVFFLSKHMSLKAACDYITKDRLIEFAKVMMDSLKILGVEDPSIAVAGLNPHSGEHGLFGMEEVEKITPAVEEMQKMGMKVSGPIGADSVFYQALNGKFDAVMSLYHDQGHIATKMVDFHRTISFTNGMPFLRTSVDHGTAFDIAGTGIASEVSMEEAIRLAAQYAPNFKKNN